MIYGFKRLNFLKVFVLLYLLAAVAFSQNEKVTVLITQNPVDFEILNRYQQKLTVAEKMNMGYFTPWEIVENDIFLSDQYTRAMHVNFNGLSYFLTMSENKHPVTIKKDSPYQIIKDCEIINDEIEITSDSTILLTGLSPQSNDPAFPNKYAEKGIRYKRIYKKDFFYMVFSEQENYYGWIKDNRKSAFRKINPNNSDSELVSISADVHTKVLAKITEVNSIYQQLFAHLNTEYSKNNISPRWEIINEEKTIYLYLHNINPERIKKSVSYLINDLENLITEQTYYVKYDSGKITLTLK